jgi:aryl-alcohol dehydrogenase-like predicted oxidoreductase
MFAWQFAEYLHKARAMGKTQFVTMQNFYNLVYREEEREMLPLAAAHGIGVIPWSPLARGFLGRSHAQAMQEATTRAKSDHVFDLRHGAADVEILRRVEETAKKHGVSNAQIALAWVLHQPGISAPIVGASKLKHLDDAIAAADIKLSAEEVAYLSGPYEPKPVIGHK